jgi:hypothetical protein
VSDSSASSIRVALSTALLVIVAALLVTAGYALQLRCEGFGCSGIGILWVAWAVVYLVALALCLTVRTALPAGSFIRRLISFASLGLVILGLVLLAYWQVKNAAA